ncbi:MAG: hypothetical protein A4E62_02215 [Syntrophorhabdus sp. PtaU1.Bin002]|nr:MAG: hypothetical protein A4E62_02215 [Syntrophorhabdus sp. PtaU1.Bin002]
MGIHDRPRLELAPPDLDIPHGGCPTLRVASHMAPPHEPFLPHCQHRAFVFYPSPHDKGYLAERLCSGSLCPPPPSRGIGRLGGRAQGCSLHLLLDSHHGGVCLLRGAPRTETVPYGPRLFCSWSSIKAYACYPPFCPSPPRLLAPWAL